MTGGVDVSSSPDSRSQIAGPGKIVGPGRVAHDEHRSLAGAPAADPGGPAGALQSGSPLGAIISAGLAPILLTGAYLIAGIFQPASYSPLRKTISVMAGQAGTDRWIMTGGIFLVGCCYLATAAGLAGVRAPARALLIVAGPGGIGLAAAPQPARGAAPSPPRRD